MKYIFVFIIIAFVFHGCGKAVPPAKKYNVILIAVDTLRADHLGCYGYPFPTSPRLDAWAKKTLFFEYAWCPIPKTSASFASMMTGLHPCIHKTKPNRGTLDEKFLTLAEMLQANGYHTVAVVDNANLSSIFQFQQGFVAYTEVWNEVENKTQSTPFITEKVISFLNSRQEKPFFLWVNYIETHTPYIPPPRFVPKRQPGRNIRELENRIVPRRVMQEMKQLNNFSEGYYIAQYDGAVNYIDAEMGKILDAFFRKGLDRNTILIFVADHGEDLGERNYFFDHGSLTFTAGARIPLMIYIPGQKPDTVRTPVSIMDIYPTILAQLRIQPPYELQGVNLLTPEKDRLLYILGVGSQAVVKNDCHFINVNPRISKKLKLEPSHFYEFPRDPRESKNLYSSRIVEAAALFAKYNQYLYKYDYFKAVHKGKGKRKLSEKDKKSLKTLGYL
jgi:arylsulfatase A-like enzyme